MFCASCHAVPRQEGLLPPVGRGTARANWNCCAILLPGRGAAGSGAERASFPPARRQLRRLCPCGQRRPSRRRRRDLVAPRRRALRPRPRAGGRRGAGVQAARADAQRACRGGLAPGRPARDSRRPRQLGARPGDHGDGGDRRVAGQRLDAGQGPLGARRRPRQPDLRLHLSAARAGALCPRQRERAEPSAPCPPPPPRQFRRLRGKLAPSDPNEARTMASDPTLMSAHELAAAFAARRLSPVEVVDALLARIARLEPRLHAFVEVYADEARLAAEAADKAIRSGHAVGPLHGVPIALKDLIDLEGRVTTGGSMAWRERRSPATATLAKKLIAAGMIVLGKTHTVEFAMGGWGTNQHLGTPWNPWDLAAHRTPGGSSSGSGVSVASGMAPWAIGTDTGGSVRLPASWCGLTGLKTTIGRVSTYGILPLAPSIDTPGPMARSVEDAALLFTVMQGADPLDRLTHSAPPPCDPFPTLRRGVKGLRLARMPEAERDGCDPEMLAAYDGALETLARLGAEIVDVKLPIAFADATMATGRIIGSEAYRLEGNIVDDMSLPVDPAVRPRIQLGRDIRAHQYLAALAERDRMKAEFLSALDGVDALLTPTTQTPAMPVDEIDQDTTPAHFTRFFNLLEMCALSIPDGF